ncbi:thiol reductant ABC exporter subunit CydC [Lichenicola sp.]|uniref:thiol reductant ABC exporter subunit CydC n=1 Tax=Lichenicola sp. TaxID=2804529 RepID=UPI003AFF62D0
MTAAPGDAAPSTPVTASTAGDDPRTGGLRPVLAILSLWRPRALRLLIGLLVSMVAFVAGLALLGASGLRLAGTGAGLVLASALLLRVLGVGRVLLRYGERLSTHDATFRALADLRVWFFRRVARSAAGGLGFRRSGDLLSRMVGDVEALDGLYLRILVPLASAVIALPILFLLALRHGPALAVALALLFVLSALLLPLAAAILVYRDSAALAGRAARLRIAVLDLVGGLREVRAFSGEGRMLAGVQGREASLLSLQQTLAQRTALAGAASFLCQQLAVVVVLASVAGLAFGRTDPIFATLLLFVLFACFETASGLVRAGALAGNVAHAAARVVGLDTPGRDLQRDEARQALLRATAPVQKGHTIRFRDVGFRWQPDRPPVFEHLTLEIPQGARVAILGPSGSGKSSLAALLLRVAIPQSGSISLGGVDLGDLDDATLRSSIGWLSQSTHLFNDTIRANLLLGRPDADDASLWQALEQAAIAEFVRGLPDGLESWIGEGGTGVSGGQGRRIALARTLLSPAPILILDEPGAGLDAETEQAFLATLNQVAAGRTVILIAHRLTGVERLDRIWRLSGGLAAAAAG